MKRQILKTLATLGFFATLAVTSAHAQTSSVQTARIPFDFNVGGRTFPSGEYRVERFGQLTGEPVVRLQSRDGRTSIFTLGRGGESRRTDGGSQLVFNRYGERYFLARIWSGDTVVELLTSRDERRLRRELKPNALPDRVTVALVTRNR
jgi:hypothetical protein